MRITKRERGRSAFWSYVQQVASKEARRDLLEPGASYDVSATFSAEVNQIPYQQQITGRLTVGHDGERASSTTPNLQRLLALLLSKIRPTEAKRLCREIPELYRAAGGELPDVDDEHLAMAKDLVERLRQKKTSPTKGTVRAAYGLLLPE